MQNCTILTFVSSEFVDIFESITDFSLVLRWGKVSTGVTSPRALTSLNIYEQCHLGPPSTLLLCCCQQGLHFRSGLSSLPWVVLWMYLFPVLPVSLSLTAQLSPAHLPALPRGSTALPCLGLLQSPICAWLAGQYQLLSTESVQGSPWLLPWPPNYRQLAPAAPWQVLDWRNLAPLAVFGIRTGHTLIWCQAQLCCIVHNWPLLPSFDQQPCAATLELWMAEGGVNINDTARLHLSNSYSQALMSLN